MASSSNTSPMAEDVGTRNWLELPRDVTATILHRLGAIEILENAQKVCMTWRSICKEPSMWRTINMHNLGDLWDMDYDLEKMCRHAIDRSCGQLVDINIEYFGTDELLEHLTQRTSQLKRLRLVSCYNISDEGLGEAVKKLPLLEELEVYFGSFSEEALKSVGNCCRQLKSLKYNRQGCKSSGMEGDEEALAIAKSMPNLRHLQLFGNCMTNDGLRAILDGCPLLESLDIRQCFYTNLAAGDMGKRLAEKIKCVRRPNDPVDDYEFDTTVFEGYGDDSCDDDYPPGFSDIDFLSDVDDEYEFSGGSDGFSNEVEFFLDDPLLL